MGKAATAAAASSVSKEEKEAALQAAFDMFDEKKTGRLRISEVQNMLQTMLPTYSRAHVQKLVSQQVDPERGLGRNSFGEFVSVFEEVAATKSRRMAWSPQARRGSPFSSPRGRRGSPLAPSTKGGPSDANSGACASGNKPRLASLEGAKRRKMSLIPQGGQTDACKMMEDRCATLHSIAHICISCFLELTCTPRAFCTLAHGASRCDQRFTSLL